VNSTKFISASELSREVGCSVGRITAAVESGIITPAGRAGISKNAAVVFLRDDIAAIKSALEAAGKFKAVAHTPRPPHICRTTEEVIQKAQALIRVRGAK
jgi:hypothetical protein